MRRTVVPAQITTVEDKIAGSLNFTQIGILMVPVFWTTIVYAVLPPNLQLAWYKLPLVLIVLLLCLVLSLRIKGKVVLSWLLVLIKYNLRPGYYLFNKNDGYLRDLYLPEVEKRSVRLFKRASGAESSKPVKSFGISDLMKLKDFIGNPNYSLSLKPDKKGGLHVALEQIQK